MDLSELQALPLPSQCKGCCSGECQCKGQGKKKSKGMGKSQAKPRSDEFARVPAPARRPMTAETERSGGRGRVLIPFEVG